MFLLCLDTNNHQETKKGIHVNSPDIKIVNSGGASTGLLNKALQSYQINHGKMANGLKRSKRDLTGTFQFIFKRKQS